jgi:hypothetical protein
VELRTASWPEVFYNEKAETQKDPEGLVHQAPIPRSSVRAKGNPDENQGKGNEAIGRG